MRFPDKPLRAVAYREAAALAVGAEVDLYLFSVAEVVAVVADLAAGAEDRAAALKASARYGERNA